MSDCNNIYDELPEDMPELDFEPIGVGKYLGWATSRQFAVAVLKVPYSRKPSGGWVRFRVINQHNGIVLNVYETLSLSRWDQECNNGVGAWRTVTIPVPKEHRVHYQAARGDIKLVTFKYV